jgi:hypothetical protein
MEQTRLRCQPTVIPSAGLRLRIAILDFLDYRVVCFEFAFQVGTRYVSQFNRVYRLMGLTPTST